MLNSIADDTGTYDITSMIEVLNVAADPTKNRWVVLHLEASSLSGEQGYLEVEVSVGGKLIDGEALLWRMGANTSLAKSSNPFIIPATQILTIDVKSPYDDDTAVTITATLFDATSSNLLSIGGVATTKTEVQTVQSIAANAITAASIAADAGIEIRTAVESSSVLALEATLAVVDTNVDAIFTITNGLNNFDPTSDQVIVTTNNDKTEYTLSDQGITSLKAALFSAGSTSNKLTVNGNGQVQVSGFGANAINAQALAGDAVSEILTAVEGSTVLSKEATVNTVISKIDVIDSNVDSILTDTAISLPGIILAQNDISTADIYTYFTTSNRELVFRADVTSLATVSNQGTIISAVGNLNNFDPANDTVAHVTLVDTTTVNTDMRGTENANLTTPPTAIAISAEIQTAANVFKADVSGLLTTIGYNSSLPTNFGDLDIEATTGKVTTANPAAGSGSNHTAADVAALILETPANKLVTNVSGQVETSNTTTVDSAAIYTYFTSSSREDAFKADNTSLATVANQGVLISAVGNLNNFDPTSETVTVGINNDKTGYALSSTSIADIDATLLDAGDATDLIASIVTRIGNTNVDQAAFVAAVKAALFSAGSSSNKLSVNGSGQVEISSLSDGAITSIKTSVEGSTVLAKTSDITSLNDVTEAEIYSYFTASNRQDTFKADVSNVLTTATYNASLPTNFGSMDINVSGEITTSNPASGGGSNHTAADVAALILDDPNNLLLTNATGQVETSNAAGVDSAAIYTYFTTVGREEVFKANTADLATISNQGLILAGVDELNTHELENVIKKNVEYRWTNSGTSGYDEVTVTDP